MAEGYNYGGTDGTTNSKFYVVCQIDISSKEATRYYIRHKYFIQVTQGNFNGTVFNRSWGGTVSVSGTGYYGDSGWINDGWYSSGQSVNLSASAGYQGSSRYYNSSVSCGYTVPNLIQVPNSPKNPAVTMNSDTQATITWTNNPDTANNKPVSLTYIDRQIDDGSWSTNINTTSSGTQTSFVIKDQSANHKYYYRLCHHNDAGTSGYVYAGPIYTSHPAPTVDSLLITSNNTTNFSVSFTINTSKINNLGTTRQWQYSIDGGSTWRGGTSGASGGTNSTTTGNVSLTQDTMDSVLLNYVKTMKNDSTKKLMVRARVYLSNNSTLTGWGTSGSQSITLQPTIWVRVPSSTTTIKAIYIRVPDNTYLAANQTLYTGATPVTVSGTTMTVPSSAGSVSGETLTLK